jgi:hypothetical protein
LLKHFVRIFQFWLITDQNNTRSTFLRAPSALVDLEKAFDSVDIDALWFKITPQKRREHLSYKSNVSRYQFYVICGENQVSSCAPQIRGVGQGCGSGPCPFYSFINDILKCIDSEGTHAPVVGGLRCRDCYSLMILL